MKALVQIPFRGVPDGEHHVRAFQPNERIEGDLAKVAIEQGWAVPERALEPHAPEERQALGGAPEPFRDAVSPTVRRRRERSQSLR